MHIVPAPFRAPFLPLLQAALSQPCKSRQEGKVALAALAEKLKAQEARPCEGTRQA